VIDAANPPSWREGATTALAILVVVFVGCDIAFALWLRDLEAPQVAVLGSGDQLSVFVSDGPARLILATGDDPIGYENALARVRPLFARRLDVLLLAGSGQSLLVPLSAAADQHVRTKMTIAPLPPSAEAEEIGPLPDLAAPRLIRLAPSTTIVVETALPFGADPEKTFPFWRATIEHDQTRIVVLSDGNAAALFPPQGAASVLVVAGKAPAAALQAAPAIALVANSEAIAGAELRQAMSVPHPPHWGVRIFPGEALRLRFVPGGVTLPSDVAQPLAATPAAVPAGGAS
jgi:hypothetical protein